MSLLDIDVSDATEPKVVPPDEEYKLRIIGVRQDSNKNGHPYLLPRFEVVDHPDAKDFTKYLAIPHDEMTPKQLERAKWALKEFLLCFGLDPSMPGNPEEDWEGQEGWAILGVSEDEEYGEQNYIKKFILPK